MAGYEVDRTWEDVYAKKGGRTHSVMAAVAYWVLLFALFSMAGWLYETIDNAIRFGGFHWRASLAGPWCPMYGIGGVLLVAAFGSWAWAPRRLPWSKAASVVGTAAGIYVVCTAVELAAALVCSFTMGYVPWDYSEEWGNFLGVVAPAFTVKFVVGGLLFVYVVAPLLRKWCDSHPQLACGLAAGFAGVLALDVTLEAMGVWADVIPREAVSEDAPKLRLEDVLRGKHVRFSELAVKR